MRRLDRFTEPDRGGWRVTGALVVMALLCASCAGFDLRSRPGTAELRGAHYSDNSGLAVATLGAEVAQPLSREWTATLRGVADQVIVDREISDVPLTTVSSAGSGSGHDHGAHGTGELEADVVTSASSAVVGGEGSEKWRFEAAPGAVWSAPIAGAPSSIGAEARVSSEPDFFSLSGLLHAQTSLFEDNTTLGVYGGYGRDRVMPSAAPPGQAADWPATHTRVLGGASVSQLLSPALRVSASGSFTLQRGTLANPYRRATVRTSLFPERLPRARDRFTAAIAAAVFLGWDVALHPRLGAYTDDWGVQAWIPELAIVKSFSERVLLDLHYRYYKQGAADFYAPAYTELDDVLAADMRLGRLHDHAFGADLQWVLFGERNAFGSLALDLRADLSLLEYEQVHTRTVVAKVFQVGLLATY